MNERVAVYAVVRVDEYVSTDNIGTITNAITVKEILPTAEEAMEEVERLNKLNQGKHCHYFWQYTRYYPEGRSKSASEDEGESGGE